MVRKMICAAFAVAVLLTASPRANAAEGTGTLRVSLDTGEQVVTSGAVTLYQVGTRVSDGYRITEGFGGGIVKEADATSPHLAKWLAETTGECGKTLLLDADGDAVFTDLEEGLYLVIQTQSTEGFYPMSPFLAEVPYEGQWYIDAQLPALVLDQESPRTGQSITPFLGLTGMVLSGTGLLLCAGKKRRA